MDRFNKQRALRSWISLVLSVIAFVMAIVELLT